MTYELPGPEESTTAEAADSEALGSKAAGSEAEGAPDERPVYQGDWNAATPAERGKHAAAVKAWKVRQAGSRIDTTFGQPVPRTTPQDSASPADPATRQVLVDIRDDPQALASDRIRAAQTLIALDKGAETAESAGSDLVVLRETLELLDPSERLAWLQGERLQALQA